MAIRIPTNEEIGERIRFVREASRLSGRQFSELLGFPDDPTLSSKLNRGERLSRERLGKIASICAGKGFLYETTPEAVMDYLEGRIDVLPAFLPRSSDQMS